MTSPLVEVAGLQTHFPVRKGLLRRAVGAVRAVDGVSFSIGKGRTLGLVGESGCGKTTVGRSLLRLVEPTGGSVRFDGRDVRAAGGAELRGLRRRMQIVFQDPYGSLNPRMKVRTILEEGLIIHRLGTAAERLERMIVIEPDFLVLDEPISALDVSIQAQVVNLLVELREQLGLTYLFISHDLSVVEYVSDDVAVMYLGLIVERAPAERLYAEPLHPYTLALFSAVPSVEPDRRRRRIVLTGDVPSPARPPAGCRFHPRCPLAEQVCRQAEPPATMVDGHAVHCHVAAREVERAGGDAAAAAACMAELMAGSVAASSTAT